MTTYHEPKAVTDRIATLKAQNCAVRDVIEREYETIIYYAKDGDLHVDTVSVGWRGRRPNKAGTA